MMEIYTTQPGVQLYSANWINNEPGKGARNTVGDGRSVWKHSILPMPSTNPIFLQQF